VRSGAKRTVIGAAGLAAVALLALPATAMAAPGDVPGTATLTAGGLTLSTPLALTFAGQLDGTNKTLTTTQALDVLDQTGSGAGWNITLSTTQFATTDTVPKTLSTTAASDFSTPTGACDTTVICTLASGSTVTYPIVLTAGTTAVPAVAVKIETAAVNTGLAGQTWTHTMNLAIPANTKVGAYLSTWTYSLVSAP
jgi:hypothetical protein